MFLLHGGEGPIVLEWTIQNKAAQLEGLHLYIRVSKDLTVPIRQINVWVIETSVAGFQDKDRNGRYFG